MDILLCSNNKFYKPMLILIHSIMKNNFNISFHIFHEQIDLDNINSLIDFVEEAGNKIEIYNISDVEIGKNIQGYLNTNATKFTYVTFLPLFAIELLNKLDRVLYLDIDMIVDGSLDKLWNMDFDGNYFIAVENQISQSSLESRKDMLFYDSYDDNYINAGMLLMNLKELKKTVNMHFILENLSKHKHRFRSLDQDFINMFWHKQIKLADIRYNLCCTETKGLAIRKSVEPVILHWPAKHKLWEELPGRHHVFYWHLETYLKYTNLPMFSDIRDIILKNIIINRVNLDIVEHNSKIGDEYIGDYNGINRIWNHLNSNQISAMQYLYENQYKKLALYGLNSLTRRFIKEVEHEDIDVCCIIDNTFPPDMFYRTLPIVNVFEYLENYQRDIDVIIIMPIVAEKAVKKLLGAFDINNVVSLNEVICSADKPIFREGIY